MNRDDSVVKAEYDRIEEKYLQLERLNHELKIMPPPKVSIALKSTLGGEVISEYTGRSHTYNRNFWNINFCVRTTFNSSGAPFGAGYLTRKQTNGSIQVITGVSLTSNLVGSLGVDNVGIVVGTSNTAESFDGFVLGALISNGTSSGKFSYSAQSATTAVYTPGTLTWEATLIRIFNNNSGGLITVAEAGIVDGSAFCLITRDLIAPSVPVANGGQLTVTYMISQVFPG